MRISTVANCGLLRAATARLAISWSAKAWRGPGPGDVSHGAEPRSGIVGRRTLGRKEPWRRGNRVYSAANPATIQRRGRGRHSNVEDCRSEEHTSELQSLMRHS